MCECEYVHVHSPWVNIWNSEDSPAALKWIREGRNCPCWLCTSRGIGGSFLCVCDHGCAFVCKIKQGLVCMQMFLTCSVHACVCVQHPPFKQSNSLVWRRPKNLLATSGLWAQQWQSTYISESYHHFQLLCSTTHPKSLFNTSCLYSRITALSFLANNNR